jgi:hypothetical protein
VVVSKLLQLMCPSQQQLRRGQFDVVPSQSSSWRSVKVPNPAHPAARHRLLPSVRIWRMKSDVVPRNLLDNLPDEKSTFAQVTLGARNTGLVVESSGFL